MRTPSYEEVSLGHGYPSGPDDFAKLIGLGAHFSESVIRYMRTAHFLTPRSCFRSKADFARCCSPLDAHAYKKCFSILDTQALCCEKENHWQELFAGVQKQEANLSRFVLKSTRDRRSSGCSMLAGVKEGIAVWVQAFIAIPDSHQAACAAGALASRLEQAAMQDAVSAVGVLRGAIDSRCPRRRALTALRRNLMLWKHNIQATWTPDANRGLKAALGALERCRQILRATPVVHLHIPKTAGISICSWADRAGFSSRKFNEAACHAPGDGAFWLGEPAVPKTCQQRSVRMSKANASWMSVERWIDLPLCDDVQYVVALRNPITRTLQHFRHLVGYHWNLDSRVRQEVEVDGDGGFFRNLFHKVWRTAEIRKKSGQGSRDQPVHSHIGGIAALADHLALWLGMASNYQVRSLAGAGNGHAFIEDATAAARRLTAAMQVLEQFDGVLVVEEGRLQQWHAHLLGSMLGLNDWQTVPPFPSYSHIHDEKGTVGHQHFREAYYPHFDQRDVDQLHVLNEADAQLVSYALLIQRLDLEYLGMVRSLVD